MALAGRIALGKGQNGMPDETTDPADDGLRDRSAPMTARIALDRLPSLVGVEFGPATTYVVTQERIDAFAALTFDEQWIHVDADAAREGPYGNTIAHGFLTLSLVSFFIGDLLVLEGVPNLINYGLDRVRFPSPVVCDSELQATMEVLEVVPSAAYTTFRSVVTLSALGAAKPACVAHTVTRAMHPGASA